MTRNVLIGIVFASAFIATDVFAVSGVDKASLTIDGKKYDFPATDMHTKTDVYFLKKYIESGDIQALDMFLGTQESRMFYIGDDFPLWLFVSREKVEVKTP